jgi:spore germination protein YaaH
MSSTNPIFRTPKSRRLVSAWVVQESADHAVARVREFQDIFDQVILMCGRVRGDGTLSRRWSQEDRKKLVDTFREMDVSTLMDWAGGWENDFEKIAASPELMKKLVSSIVADCEATGADGVDIDLEHLPATARFPFTDFFGQLSEALHARNLMLSICTGGYLSAYRRDWAGSFIDVPVIARYADHIRQMNYDMHFPRAEAVPGPTSTAPWVRDMLAYTAREVPRGKLIAGLPTYSVDWNMLHPEKSDQIYNYEWIAEREKEAPQGRQWVSYEDISFLRYTDAEGSPHLLYVTDGRSTRSNLVFVDEVDVAGVCFWCLQGDDPAIWQAVREQFRRK